ncbi:MAG TPA: hypothetical protein VIL30_03245, partial [Ramlibacter sp.]
CCTTFQSKGPTSSLKRDCLREENTNGILLDRVPLPEADEGSFLEIAPQQPVIVLQQASMLEMQSDAVLMGEDSANMSGDVVVKVH